MDRLELLDKLKLVAPALSDKELIPVLNHLWFRGDTVMAFNDQIAIQTKLKTPFKGAVPGRTLIDMLETCSETAKNVDFVMDGDDLEVKAGNTRLSLKVLPVEDFVFDMPKMVSEGIEGPKDFLPAVECCMQSISNDTSIPDQLGLTVVPNGKTLDLYTTDNATLTHARVEVKVAVPARVILSKPFCEQVIAITNGGIPFRLVIATDHVLMKTDRADLFGRLIDSEDPLDFASIMEEHLPKGERPKLYKIPKTVKYAIDRALIITETKMHETKTLVQVKSGNLSFYSKSPRGEMHDKIFDEEKWFKQHPDIAVRLNPRLLKAGQGRFDELLFTKTCAIMMKGDMVYLVSASTE